MDAAINIINSGMFHLYPNNDKAHFELYYIVYFDCYNMFHSKGARYQWDG